MRWIPEEQYALTMQSEVEPFLAARRETGFDERVQGQPIYFEHYRADSPRGVVVLSHGFTESVTKFAEPVYYLLQEGFEVWGLDHRGHGRSFRANDNPFVVHAERFADYVEDLRHLTETQVKPAAGVLPVYLLCHSMGGCIGALCIEQYPVLFDKAVLSSPMLGISFGGIPLWLASLAAALKGLPSKGKDPLSPVTAFPKETYENSASNSPARFQYYYEKKLADKRLQTCAGSTKWGREAIKACQGHFPRGDRQNPHPRAALPGGEGRLRGEPRPRRLCRALQKLRAGEAAGPAPRAVLQQRRGPAALLGKDLRLPGGVMSASIRKRRLRRIGAGVSSCRQSVDSLRAKLGTSEKVPSFASIGREEGHPFALPSSQSPHASRYIAAWAKACLQSGLLVWFLLPGFRSCISPRSSPPAAHTAGSGAPWG